MSTPKSSWTILVYLAAHNNLSSWGKRSLDQILGVGSTPQIRLAALSDRFGGARRYIAGDDGQPLVEEPLGRFDSGDPEMLIDTARWAFERCPAERYALVLWSHGSGWRPENAERSAMRSSLSNWTPEEMARIAQQVWGDNNISERETTERSAQAGSMALFRTTLTQILKQDDPLERAICFDDGSGHSLDTLELERVVREIEKIIGQPLDLLGMDACVMSTLEVAYQLRQHVRYLVASEELVPAQSWPYDTILGALREEPEMPARDLAALVVRHYAGYYKDYPPQFNGGDVTKVALDLAHIDEINTAVDELAGALSGNIQNQAPHLWDTQRKSKEQETQTPNGQRRYTKFDFHLWDLSTLAANLAGHSQNTDVRVAAHALQAAFQPGGAVIAEEHQGEWFDGIGGVSIYAVPPGVQRISPYYSELALARETRWGKMLEAYHQALA